MAEEKAYFIELLSSYVNQNCPKCKIVDFDELFRLACINDVGAIIADRLALVENKYKPGINNDSKFRQLLAYSVIADAKRNEACNFTKEFLNKAKCRYVFVKGINIKNYYPNPEYRTSGDIDVIVDKDVLEVLKTRAKESNIKVLKYVANTLTLLYNGIEIEVHSDADVKNSYFDDIFSLCNKISAYEYRLDEYNELLFAVCHTAKHIAYRGAGIRMLIDIDLMIRGINYFDEDKFYSLCQKANISKTFEVLIAFCKKIFNTPIKCKTEISENLVSSLENVFIDGGSFGYELNSVPAKYLENGSKSKIAILFKMAFPSKEYLKICYPYYKKHAFLYPVARVNRIYDGLFKKRKHTKDVLHQVNSKEDFSVRIKILNELKLK